MKFTAKSGNTERLLFNDLGKDIKNVSPQEKNIALDPGDFVYLPDSSGVLFSAKSGDAKKYFDAGKLDIDDTPSVVAGGTFTVTHGFNFQPHVTVTKKVGSTWPETVNGSETTITHKTAFTEIDVKNTTGGTLILKIHVG